MPFLHYVTTRRRKCFEWLILSKSVLELSDVFVTHHFQDLDLSQNNLLVLLVGVILEFLYGDCITRGVTELIVLLVAGFAHHAVLALADRAENFVLVHNKIIMITGSSGSCHIAY